MRTALEPPKNCSDEVSSIFDKSNEQGAKIKTRPQWLLNTSLVVCQPGKKEVCGISRWTVQLRVGCLKQLSTPVLVWTIVVRKSLLSLFPHKWNVIREWSDTATVALLQTSSGFERSFCDAPLFGRRFAVGRADGTETVLLSRMFFARLMGKSVFGKHA